MSMKIEINISDDGKVDIQSKEEITLVEMLGLLEVAKIITLNGESAEEIEEEIEETYPPNE